MCLSLPRRSRFQLSSSHGFSGCIRWRMKSGWWASLSGRHCLYLPGNMLLRSCASPFYVGIFIWRLLFGANSCYLLFFFIYFSILLYCTSVMILSWSSCFIIPKNRAVLFSNMWLLMVWVNTHVYRGWLVDITDFLSLEVWTYGWVHFLCE